MPDPVDEALADARRIVRIAHGVRPHISSSGDVAIVRWDRAVTDTALRLMRRRGIPVVDQHGFPPCSVCGKEHVQ